MTKRKIRMAALDELWRLTLAELEMRLMRLERGPQNADTQQAAREVRVAIRKRQRVIKTKAMLFEETNDHHLVLFESTCGFWKMAGRSVLIYSQTIAERIAQRYRIVQDRDLYAVSQDGIISFRNFELLNRRLQELGLERDAKMEEPGIIYFRLKKVYTDEQIQKLRDKASVDRKWLEEMVLPKSPMPALYEAALKLNKLLYNSSRSINDRFARAAFGEPIVARSGEILRAYYRYAGLRTPLGKRKLALQNFLAEAKKKPEVTSNEAAGEYLLEIWEAVVDVRDRLAVMENLKLMHWKEVGEAIELTGRIEKMVGQVGYGG